MKNYILDTNVLLFDPAAIEQFAGNQVILPFEVIEELDTFKRDMTELGENSRAVSQYLDQVSKNGRLANGVKIDNGGILQIHAGFRDDFLKDRGVAIGRKVDNRILNLALNLKKHVADRDTIIISKNINLRLKAEAVGIDAEDYGEGQVKREKSYRGYDEIMVSPEDIKKFRQDRYYDFCDRTFYHNTYILLKSDHDQNLSAMGRIDGKSGNRMVPVSSIHDGVLGIRPLNLEQNFALDALLNDDIRLITLLGKAGTGKTLLAVAAGLYKVLVEDKYNKLLVSRPIMPLGRDIGYIPGDVEDKMRPWMHPIYDALEMIKEQDRRSRKRILPPDILNSEEIGVEPLTYIRGRSIPHQFFVIDEAQNLTPHEVKTIITRIGFNSKVVLTGDLEQIDNPYVDSGSNGFSYLVDRFKKERVSAHITLAQGERSELAALAANLL